MPKKDDQKAGYKEGSERYLAPQAEAFLSQEEPLDDHDGKRDDGAYPEREDKNGYAP